jgi:hypothetical protein
LAALVLAPGIQALAHYKRSTVGATNCENQESFEATAGFGGSCQSLGGTLPLHTVGFVEPAITTATHIGDSLCATDGLIVVKDANCNEVYRAAAVCLRSTDGAARTWLVSCNNDIEIGTWGLPENIK